MTKWGSLRRTRGPRPYTTCSKWWRCGAGVTGCPAPAAAAAPATVVPAARRRRSCGVWPRAPPRRPERLPGREEGVAGAAAPGRARRPPEAPAHRGAQAMRAESEHRRTQPPVLMVRVSCGSCPWAACLGGPRMVGRQLDVVQLQLVVGPACHTRWRGTRLIWAPPVASQRPRAGLAIALCTHRSFWRRARAAVMASSERLGTGTVLTPFMPGTLARGSTTEAQHAGRAGRANAQKTTTKAPHCLRRCPSAGVARPLAEPRPGAAPCVGVAVSQNALSAQATLLPAAADGLPRARARRTTWPWPC